MTYSLPIVDRHKFLPQTITNSWDIRNKYPSALGVFISENVQSNLKMKRNKQSVYFSRKFDFFQPELET